MSARISDLFANHPMVVMGIVNVTPDSFSDGGRFAELPTALSWGLSLLDQGADLLDFGGESTRPGSQGVDARTERERVVPVIEAVHRERPDAVISVDTSKVEVARAALDAGATVVNDVTAGREAGMFELVAERGAELILMHMRGEPRTMQKDTHYDDVLEEVRSFLLERAEAAQRAGVARERIFLDPGIGFGKDLDGNLALLRGLPRLADAGYPIVLGTSRKSFLGLITGAEVGERLGATLASLIPALSLSRVVVRVHDVAEVVRFRAVIEALRIDRASFSFRS